jgi:hypothetical protein
MHGTRYRGAAVHFYPAVMSGGVTVRAHLRVCKVCALEVLDVLQEHAKPPSEDGLYEALQEHACASCGEPVTTDDITCFLTVYMPDDDRRDFWARYHMDCLDPPYVMALESRNGPKSSPGAA